MARTAVVVGTATAVSGSMHNKQEQKAASQQQAAAAQQQAAAAPPAPAPSATDDAMAQIQKLGELKAAGLLTDEEFAAAKAKVLGI
jgi:membrane protease subunit (stomatin/prohibitin family)